MGNHEISEANYRAAQRLLNRADFGHIDLADEQRESLNGFIRRYQTERYHL